VQRSSKTARYTFNPNQLAFFGDHRLITSSCIYTTIGVVFSYRKHLKICTL
jgi:hypothetical protein